jgi:integrase
MKITSKKSIDAFNHPPGTRDHWEPDDEIPNFYLRSRVEGSRSLVFSYKVGGKTRKISFGPVAALNISKTRETAKDLNAQIRLGQDPAGERTAAKIKAAETFKATIPRFLSHQRARLRPRSYTNQERHLLVDAKMLHGLQLEKIMRRDIATCIAAVAENSGKRTGNIVRSSLNAFFVWTLTQGLIDHNPVIGTLKHAEKTRDRVLAPAELRTIWNNLADDHFGSIVKLLALTGQRAAEISELRWSEVDLNSNMITLSGERTKNGRPHTIPLSGAACAIIAAQPRRVTADGRVRDLIFGIGAGPFSGWSNCKQALDERIAASVGSPLSDWRIHDLRRSFATHSAEIGIAPHIIEAVLNHISGHRAGVAGTYNRALYEREKCVALDRWGEWLTAVIEGRQSNIVALSLPA